MEIAVAMVGRLDAMTPTPPPGNGSGFYGWLLGVATVCGTVVGGVLVAVTNGRYVRRDKALDREAASLSDLVDEQRQMIDGLRADLAEQRQETRLVKADLAALDVRLTTEIKSRQADALTITQQETKLGLQSLQIEKLTFDNALLKEDADKTIRSLEQRCQTFQARVETLIRVNTELETENTELKSEARRQQRKAGPEDRGA